jgi:drug/metabolite transporter (DMT)-like permease
VPEERRAPRNALERIVSDALYWRSSSVISAGAELGIWMCLAFGLELYALESVPATRASFIMQSQVIVTPILVWLSRVGVKSNEWTACLLGLLGSSLVVLDGLMKASLSEDTVTVDASGYILLALSVFSYSLWIVRLGRYSSQFPPLELTLTKNSFLSLYSLVFLLLPLPGAESIQQLSQEMTALFTSPEKCLLIAWLGLGPSALAGYLQAVGQKAVPAAQAQVIYSTTPLFASAIAFFLLDASEEAMGGIAWLGASIMILASVVASTGRED